MIVLLGKVQQNAERYLYHSGGVGGVTVFHRWVKLFEGNYFIRKSYNEMVNIGGQKHPHIW